MLWNSFEYMYIILLLYLIYFKIKFDLFKNWKPDPITSLFIIQ